MTKQDVHVLANARGMVVRFIPLGGAVTAIEVPDRDGRPANVALGFRDLADYAAERSFFGAITGRYANRIGGAAFTLDGHAYRLPANNGANTLHGGNNGFDRKLWQVERVSGAAGAAARLRYTSPDGEEGFPGALAAIITYSVTESNEFRIDYEATADKPTVINLTNHSFFNLAGEGSGDVLDHLLEIAAARYTVTDAALIPTGEIAAVAGTPLDFRRATPIGARIRDCHPHMVLAHGYDHNYVLDGGGGATPSLAARAHDPGSGRIMEVLTTEPGVQLYSGNFLDGRLVGPSGHVYRQSDGFCLETQHFPDSPNKPAFPSVALRPGEVYRSTTVYRFLTDAG